MQSLTQHQTLSIDQLRVKAPSIFTADSSERTSHKYQHISTLKVVEGLMGEGFMPVWATQCRTRIQAKRAYTKHMMRFRHVDAQANHNGLYPELVLINSHDGLSSYRLMAGVYRMVCSNGLIAGNTYNETRVRHQGDIVDKVIEGTYEVMKESALLIDSAQTMTDIVLNSDEKRIFAEAAHQLKFDGGENNQSQAIEPLKILRPRRYQENDKHDLFTTFNIAQENLIKGGLSGWGRDANNRVRRVTTREVKSIDQSTALNRALWTLAEKIAELKR